MSQAALIKRMKARVISAQGFPIQVGAQTLSALTRSVNPSDKALLPEGTDNASFADMTLYRLIPGEMAAKNIVLPPGATFLDSGVSFTVLASPLPKRPNGVPAEQIVIAYRTPQADAVVAAADQTQNTIWKTREVSP